MDGIPLCHPSDGSTPDCYRLVTVYGQPVPGCGNPYWESNRSKASPFVEELVRRLSNADK